MLRLVMFYTIGNEGPSLCEWARIRPDQRLYPTIAKIVRELPGWADCHLIRIERLSKPLDPTPLFEARFERLNPSNEVEVLATRYYASHQDEETTTREEFRAYLKTLADSTPADAMENLVQFSYDPETDHHELNHIMNLLLSADLEECSAAQ